MRPLALLVTTVLFGGIGLLGARAVPGAPAASVRVAAGVTIGPATTFGEAPTTVPVPAPFVCPITPGISRAEHIALHHPDVAPGSGGVATAHAGHAAAPATGTPHHQTAGAAPGSGGQSHAAHTADGTCQPTPEQVAAAQKLVDDTRAAISVRFADQRAARAAGYAPGTGSDVFQRAVHYGNKAEANAPGTLDPNHPETLVYGDTDRHGRVLLGVVYIVAERGQPGPDIGGCLTHWHSHGFDGYARDMLHVWIVDMPGGPFADPDAEYIRNL